MLTMFRLLLVLTFTFLYYTMINSIEKTEPSEDQIHDATQYVIHKIDRGTLRSINQIILSQLKIQSSKEKLTNYLQGIIEDTLESVFHDVVDLLQLSGSREEILRALEPHLDYRHFSKLVRLSGGDRWEREIAQQLSDNAVRFLNEKINQLNNRMDKA